MAGLKRSGDDSSSHGPNKFPRLSSFYPDEDPDILVRDMFGRFMRIMRDREDRYNTFLAFASDDHTEFQKVHAKIIEDERCLEQAMSRVYKMAFSVHEELDAIEDRKLMRTATSEP